MKRFFLLLALGLVSFVTSSCVEYQSMGPPPSSSGRPNPDSIGPARDYAGYSGYRSPAEISSGSKNFYGHPRDWYTSGYRVGKEDRLGHLSEDYRRHADLFDERTMREFARGYDDGYVGRNH